MVQERLSPLDLMDAYDKSGDYKISRKEFIVMMKKVSVCMHVYARSSSS